MFRISQFIISTDEQTSQQGTNIKHKYKKGRAYKQAINGISSHKIILGSKQCFRHQFGKTKVDKTLHYANVQKVEMN